jgi:hypothetical protein
MEIENEATPPAEESTTPEVIVEKPEAVLKKNQELLGKLKREQAQREELAAKVAAFEQAEAKREEEKLQKKGDFEELIKKRDLEQQKKDAAKDARYESLFTQYAEKELQLAIPAEVFEDSREDFSIVLRTKYLKPVEEDGKLVWKSLDGLETIDLKTFIPTLEATHGRFFKADNNPGGDAPGNSQRIGTGVKRSAMTTKEKTAFIRANGQAAYQNLPL